MKLVALDQIFVSRTIRTIAYPNRARNARAIYMPRGISEFHLRISESKIRFARMLTCPDLPRPYMKLWSSVKVNQDSWGCAKALMFSTHSIFPLVASATWTYDETLKFFWCKREKEMKFWKKDRRKTVCLKEWSPASSALWPLSCHYRPSTSTSHGVWCQCARFEYQVIKIVEKQFEFADNHSFLERFTKTAMNFECKYL